MRGKHIYKRSKFMAAGVLALTFLFSGNVYATKLYAAEKQSVALYNDGGHQLETASAKQVWYYKKMNGKTYKRLWDESNGKWLTDWILCS